MNRKKHLIGFSLLLIFIILWSIWIYRIGPEALVDMIGVKSSYLLAFLMATFGGVSTLTTGSFYATIITLALAGINIFALGLVSGIGLMIGDTLFFYFGRTGHDLVPEKWKKIIGKFSNWLNKKPNWIIWLIIFFYTGFTPFPADILTVSLGLIAYPYKKMFLPLFLGNIILPTLISYLAIRGVSLFV